MKRGGLLYCLAAALLATVVLTGCNFFGKNKAELAKQRQDSIAQAKRVQDSLDAIQRRVSDSLARVQQQEAEMAQLAAQEQARANALKFHVVLGSFRVPSNADDFLRIQLNSHSAAKIFDSPNGFKLVTIADFATMEEAVAYINRHQSSNDEGEPIEMWVFEEGGRYDTSSYLESLSGDDF